VTGVAATQAATTTAIQPAKIQKPSQLLSLRPLLNVVEVGEQPGGEDQADVGEDEQQEPGED
jgi:hypothetical protein